MQQYSDAEQARNERRLLKRFGTIKEVRDGFNTRIGKVKRKFVFDERVSDEQERKRRAKTLAEEHLVEQTLEKYAVNTYCLSDDGHAAVQVRSSEDTDLVFELLVDNARIDDMRDRVWWCRVKSGGEPMYVYCADRGKRLQLVEHLFGTNQVHYHNGSVLDCRRVNVTTTDDVNASARNTVAAPVVVVMPAGDIPCLPFENFCRFFAAKGPFIPQPAWLLCKQFAAVSPVCKKLLATTLSQQLVHYYPNLPLPHYSHAELMSDLLSAELSAVMPLDIENLSQNQQQQSLMSGTQGLAVCKQFYVDAMAECGYQVGGAASAPSVVKQLWQRQVSRDRIVKTAINSPKKTFNAASIWSATNLSYYVPANFLPLAARQLYENFAIAGRGDAEVRVLDFCMGWGGRFLGFWLSKNVTHYTGIDVSPRVHQRCAKMIGWLHQHCPRPEKTFRLIEAGAETPWQAPHSEYDMVFTSPPYFKRENYEPDNAAQSCNAFASSYNSWLCGFLVPAMTRAAAVLRPGGYMIINVADTALCKTLVADTKRILVEQLSLTFVATLRLPMPRRPNNKQRDSFEPVLVARKPPAAE